MRNGGSQTYDMMETLKIIPIWAYYNPDPLSKTLLFKNVTSITGAWVTMGIEGQNDILLYISEVVATGNSRNAEMVCTYFTLQKKLTPIASPLPTTMYHTTDC